VESYGGDFGKTALKIEWEENDYERTTGKFSDIHF
jgi:hypothetical protein